MMVATEANIFDTPPASLSPAYDTVVCWHKMRSGVTCGAFVARIDVDTWEETMEASKHVRQKCKKCGNWYSLYEFDRSR